MVTVFGLGFKYIEPNEKGKSYLLELLWYSFTNIAQYQFLGGSIFSEKNESVLSENFHSDERAEASYLLSADVTVDVAAMIGVEFDTSIKVTDELKSLEIGLNEGLGIEFPISSFNAFFEASYGFGLTNVNNLEGVEDFKNRMIYLNMGIKF